MHEGQKCEHCNCGQADFNGKNESVWVDTQQLAGFPPLVQDTSVDVVIIGAGITGLTAGLDLIKAGKSVAILEASKIGKGVTGYTTAHVTSIIDTRFQDLIKKLGEDKTKLLADSTQAAIKKIAATIAEHNIECDWQTVPGYLYTEQSDEVAILQDEAQAGSTLGLSATFTQSVPLPFATAGAAKFDSQAQFHPLKYLHGLVQAFTAAGGKIYEMTRVIDVDDGTPCTIKTDRASVTAGAVIMATHTPITKMLLIQSKVEPYRSYVVGFKSSTTLPTGIFWDIERPYHYIRSYQTAEGQLLIVGGEDHKTGEKTDAEARYEALTCYVKERFPDVEIVYRWSAQVFEPIDYLPYIGRAPFAKHIYIATGYAGNGMTFGTIAAQLCTQLILNGSAALEKLYQPTRLTLAADVFLRQIKISLSIGRHLFLDRLSRGDGGDVASLSRGEGKILQVDGKKMAVYKDKSGQVTKLSPVCTHAGCIVAWNNAEKTWDCPCHGGRYAPDGKVINGPPIKDLTYIA